MHIYKCPNSTATVTMSSNQQAQTKNSGLVALDSGDEFEDFPVENWDTDVQNRPTNLWEENWEDEDHLDDDFAAVLKAESTKMNSAH